MFEPRKENKKVCLHCGKTKKEHYGYACTEREYEENEEI